MRDLCDDRSESHGSVWYELRRADGSLKAWGRAKNLITAVGDQIQAERASGVASTQTYTGMKLGTGSATPTKTSTGAALGTYLTGSHQPFVATYPQSAPNGASRRITFQCLWAAGVATSASTPITEVVLVNNSPLTDATSSAANTLHRALILGVPSKQSTESLTVTWTWDLQGT